MFRDFEIGAREALLRERTVITSGECETTLTKPEVVNNHI